MVICLLVIVAVAVSKIDDRCSSLELGHATIESDQASELVRRSTCKKADRSANNNKMGSSAGPRRCSLTASISCSEAPEAAERTPQKIWTSEDEDKVPSNNLPWPFDSVRATELGLSAPCEILRLLV